MQLGKTDKARDVLAGGTRGGVDMRERRILILADGRRTLEDVIAMLGEDIRPAVDRLVREGYLSPSTRAPVAMEIAPRVGPVATQAPAARRRSLVAAKMYLIDMLQLQRSTEAADLRLAIQSTGDEALLVERLLEGLAHLCATTTASYGARVRERLSEVLPEALLPRLSSVG
ncbi:hypothetical protein LYSHEL_06390 [Lysobacter helvus]|uniref:Uncharacterized protein n=2 Tax=Lysobacteraceae TaxID=32033 RepID=A0ABN6FQM6_9GAMM|nr:MULTISPECIES: hypothetical protein [Lysobacter]BCT91615.1 hypothetical protein LYSCAS_06390 [Lysobacter caseinilyticus]BCT94768.1 hypothetical protein LYSHEL_06390 [Lysobacter helvus]